jgi:beta-glucanase (GH16 family)
MGTTPRPAHPAIFTAGELPDLYAACLAADQAERRAIDTTDFSEQGRGTHNLRTFPVLPCWDAAVDAMRRHRVRWIEARWLGGQ